MSPAELLLSVERYLADPDPDAAAVLERAAAGLEDMVGWASGPIDPEGRFATRLMSLQDALRARHALHAQGEVAALHDALAALREAIARHDRDLDPAQPDEDTVDF